MSARTIWLERRKWPNTPHYGHDAIYLGDDDDGTWLGLPEDRPVYRGSHVLFVADSRGLVLVPHDEWWMAWFPEGRRFSLYVDIVTPPRRREDTITMVDLDLDVIRTTDGTVELLDEDEFDEHQVSLHYPPDIIEGARRSADAVLAAVQAGAPPFHAPATRWLETFNLEHPQVSPTE